MIKVLRQRGHTILLFSAISLEVRYLTALIFFGDANLSTEGEYSSEVQGKLQYDTLTWSGVIRAIGGFIRPEHLFYNMEKFDWY